MSSADLNTLYISDGAKVVTDCGVGATGQISEAEAAYDRLLVVANRVAHLSAITRALLPVVVMVQYRYETSTFDGIISLIEQALGSRKVSSIGFAFHATGSDVHICSQNGGQTLSVEALKSTDSPAYDLFKSITSRFLFNKKSSRIDLLACPLDAAAGAQVLQLLTERLTTKALISMSSDLFGGSSLSSRVQTSKAKTSPTGSIYFHLDTLTDAMQVDAVKLSQSTAMYEKIRVVGKGAFGAAVLYRRRDDDSYVILKEINMHDLSSSERQLALNEVAVLARLQHPNIIAYYDHFEEDGVLMIEMEYAEGGSLAQYLAKREQPLEEKDVLNMFNQMVSSVQYMHENNVLHRDLKTANVFLTRENTVKLGDFGISKVMSTATKAAGANTVLGTPYYFSPEMCEGKSYNEKSDIWALGCILYEMACLQKTFEGSNLPALVNKIMKGQYDQIRGNYSADFKALVRDLLHRDPEHRPTVADIAQRVQRLLARYVGRGANLPGGLPTELRSHDDDSTDSGAEGRRKMRSVMYALDAIKNQPGYITNRLIDGFPTKMRIKSVAMSASHTVALSSEKLVYSWGDNDCGQLALDDFEPRASPTLVQSLTGKSIARIAVGNGLSVFCSDNGLVMTCGRWDLVGHGPIDSNVARPKLIESLLNIDILEIGCGPEHTVALGEGGKVFAWGCGEHGRLGTGQQQDEHQPVEVYLPASLTAHAIRCGNDCTILLTHTGVLLVTGSNAHNKLNLNQRQGFFTHLKLSKPDVDRVLVPTLCKTLPSRAIDASAGVDHTAVLVQSGHVYTFGRNNRGQLGRGHAQPITAHTLVKSIANLPCTMVRCGDGYTVAVTAGNTVYFWGTRYDTLQSHALRRSRLSTTAAAAATSTGHQTQESRLTTPASHSSNAGNKPVALVHPFAPDGVNAPSASLSVSLPNPNLTTAIAGSTTLAIGVTGEELRALTPHMELDTEDETPCAKPTQILQLDSQNNAMISVSSVVVCGQDVYIVVDTNVPVPRASHDAQQTDVATPSARRALNRPQVQAARGQTSVMLPGHQRTASEPTTAAAAATRAHTYREKTTLPTWLKREMDDATVLPVINSNKPADQQLPRRASARVHHSSSSSLDRLQPIAASQPAAVSSARKRKKKQRPRSAELERLRQQKSAADAQVEELRANLQLERQQHAEAAQRQQQLHDELETIKRQMAVRQRPPSHSVQPQPRPRTAPVTSDSSKVCAIL